MNNDAPEYNHLEMKKSILDKLLVIIFVIGLPSLIILIISMHKAGKFPYATTAGLSATLLFILFRKKIPFLVKAWTLIAFGYILGTLGLTREGLLSDGMMYFVVISILSSMLINIRSGIIIIAISILTVASVAFAIEFDWINYDFDIVAYFYAPGTWVAFILTLAMFTSMAVIIYGMLEKFLFQFIHELTEKSNKLNDSNVQLGQEMEERLQAEYHLRQSEIKFKSVFNSMADGILLLKEDYSVLDANDSFLKLSGKTREAVLNKTLGSFFQDFGKLRKFIETNDLNSTIFNKNEFHLKLPHGQTMPVEFAIHPYQQSPEIIHIAVIKDITDKKETEIKIMNAVISSEDEERMRLAQDLHDGVGPYLSAIRLYLNSFGIAENDHKSLSIKKELHELVNLSINSIREISGNLGSHVLRSLGLKAALASYIEKIRVNNLFTYSSNIPDHYPFTENVEIALYRVIIELLNNSVKYGQPHNIRIELNESKTEISIQYNEDGIGFNLQEALSQRKGMGLYNIHSRINSLGGLVEFNSIPGKGVDAKFIFSKTIACKIV